MYDLQKANMWKRISAGLFDFILICILSVGIAALLSFVLKYDGYYDTLNERYAAIGEELNLDFFIDDEDYFALSEEEQLRYNEGLKVLYEDDQFVIANYMIFNLSFIIVIFSTLIAFLLLEFLVPMLFKNGQTLGKKIFGVAVMRIDGVKISGPILFTRTVLGKYTVETMLPIIFVLMVIFNVTNVLSALIAIGAIFLTHIIMMIVSKNNAGIHDIIANTVTVDYASQLIFDSPEALLEYKKNIHAEEVEHSQYK